MSFLNDRLNDLKDEDPHRRARATKDLWNFWYQEAGEEAEKELHKGIKLMDSNELLLAEEHFFNMTKKYPHFPEAQNKLATVLYMLKKYCESVEICKQVTLANPYHFGAWNGSGLCLIQLGRFDEAIKSFEKALEIQPYAEVNAHYIARCRGALN